MRLHPDAGTLQRYAESGGHGRIAVHVAGCGQCAATVDWIETVRRTLREAPRPSASVSAWADIRARLDAGDTVVLPTGRDRASWRNRTRIAAALALTSLAGVAAAMPGSPLRGWVTRALEREAAASSPTSTGAATIEESQVRTRLLVDPHDGQATIALERPSADLQLRVRWVENGRIDISATGVASRARFRSGPGRLTITDVAGGEIVLALPRGSGVVTVTVDGESWLVQREGDVTVSAPTADTVGGEILLLVRPAAAGREP